MNFHKLIIIMFSAFVTVNSAFAVQIGPEIRIGGGNATIGGVGIKDGKAAVPTIDEAINTVINSTPSTVLLSQADKDNVKAAIKTTGFISLVAADPVTGIIIISVLSGNGEETQVPVPTVDQPPTGKIWSHNANCIVLQDGGVVTAMFITEPAGIRDIQVGDTVNLTASYCSAYGKNSVTAITTKKTGSAPQPNAKPPQFSYYLVGKPI